MPFYDGYINAENYFLHNDRFEFEISLSYMRQLGLGLAYIHASGVIHLDLKPANLLINVHSMKLIIIDFGCCTLTSGDEGGSSSERFPVWHGNVEYMCPEIGRGGKVTTKSDIFSFGLIIYYFLTGTTPYVERFGDNKMFIFYARCSGDPITISDDIPAVLHPLLESCFINTNPGERPNAMDVSSALAEI